MFYIFLQTWIWLLLATLLGIGIGWIMWYRPTPTIKKENTDRSPKFVKSIPEKLKSKHVGSVTAKSTLAKPGDVGTPSMENKTHESRDTSGIRKYTANNQSAEIEDKESDSASDSAHLKDQQLDKQTELQALASSSDPADDLTDSPDEPSLRNL